MLRDWGPGYRRSRLPDSADEGSKGCAHCGAQFTRTRRPPCTAPLAVFLLALSSLAARRTRRRRIVAGGAESRQGGRRRPRGGRRDRRPAERRRPGAAGPRSASRRRRGRPAWRGGNAAPFSLTATDAPASRWCRRRTRRLEPPLAFTECTSPSRTRTTARSRAASAIALPPGAALSRFAIEARPGLQEASGGGQRAGQVYEDFLHTARTRRCSSRKRPTSSPPASSLPARGRKEIVVSVARSHSSDEPYVLPLLGRRRWVPLDASVLLGERPAANVGTGGPVDPEAR